MAPTPTELSPFLMALIGCAGLLLLKFVYNALCSSGSPPPAKKKQNKKKGGNNNGSKGNKKKKAVNEISAFIAENSGNLRKRSKKQKAEEKKQAKPEPAAEKKPTKGGKSKKSKAAAKPTLSKAEKEQKALEKAQRKLKEGKVTLKQKDIDDGWEVAVKPKGKRGNRNKNKSSNDSGSSASGATKVSVQVESRKIGVIIGPKGSNLHKIQDGTGCTIQVPRLVQGSTSTYVSVTIEGPANQLARAKQAVNDMTQKGHCEFTISADFAEDSVMVHPMYFPDLIGKNGKVIRAIQDMVGARVNIPKTPANGTGRVRVGISGPKSSVQQAKDVVYSIMQFYHHEITHPGMIHAELNVPDWQRGIVVGPKGSTIHHIQGNWKVNVVLPNQNSLNGNTLVVGLPNDVEGAKKYILKILSDADEERTQNSVGLGVEDGDDAWGNGEADDGGWGNGNGW